MRTTRSALLRWAGWFAAANAALFMLAGLRFLASYPFSADPLGLVYGLLAYTGHFALLAALPVGLLVVPLALAWPQRAVVTATAAVVEGVVLALLVVDGNVFAEQRYHLTPLTAVLFETTTWVFIGIIAFFSLVFEFLLSGYVWRWVEGEPRRGGRMLAGVLCAAWLGSQGIHIWADAIGYTSVTQLTRYLPAYFPIHAKRSLARMGLVDESLVERRRQLQKAADAAAGQLHYPLRPLECADQTPSLNILFVLIDALRPDAVDPDLLPNIAAFGRQGALFENHWSGGNSSRAGIFSMFYGLPSTYQETFYGVQQPPLLLQLARRQQYQLGLFSAPGFSTPTDIGRTVFAGVPGLPGERGGVTAVERNRAVTDDWLAWLGARDPSRRFLGFLYYDPPMGEMPGDDGAALPMDGRFNSTAEIRDAWRRYRLAARMVDGEVGRLMASLEQAGLRENTVVILSSDHGYEFDDNGLGYLGHASSYSPAQVRATLMLHWPGRAPAVYRHRSSHYDLPVTLLRDVFGCVNDPADYAIGHDIFAGRDWDWILAGSYNSHAIIQPGSVIVTHPGGFVEVLDDAYRPVAGADIDAGVVAEAMSVMRRFYR